MPREFSANRMGIALSVERVVPVYLSGAGCPLEPKADRSCGLCDLFGTLHVSFEGVGKGGLEAKNELQR